MTRTATEAARLLESGELTTAALLREYAERIEERERTVGAWEHLDLDYAMQMAHELDRGPRRGPLHGIPIGVKDIIDVAGMPARYGTVIYEHHVASADAACVALSKAAGAIVPGKTVTTELAWFHPGKTKNPHNPAHTPGGSSSGSAAAVAAGMVPLAFGTQTAGSVIRPAAYCGVVGFKPTFGVVPRAGVKSQSESLDTIGCFANCVDDVALMGAALWRDDRFLNAGAASQPRIGVFRVPEWEQASVDMHAAVQSAASAFAKAGASVRDVQAPAEFTSLNASQTDVQLFEAARSYFPEYDRHRAQLSERIVTLIGQGLNISWERYRASWDHAAQCRLIVADLFRDFDALLMPAAPGAAPKGLAATGDPMFNRMTTMLQLPCIALPHFKDADRMPLGIQLVGHARGDRVLMEVARWAEAVLRDQQ
jgi:Asp-tRNA(Asn)/Glu-tRNA(Gln) amidotransferase A subunit family amidase